ncbi:MAG: trypsin-like peptidase domain-containing protein [bacterium]
MNIKVAGLLIALLSVGYYSNFKLFSKDNGKIYIESNRKLNDTEQASYTDSLYDNLAHSRRNAITEAVAKSSPAVVGINVTEVRKVEYRDPIFDDPFFQRFFGYSREPRYRNYEVQGLGSGFIISPDGYILTNHHVAGNASKVVVTMAGGEKYDAEIIGSDRISDVSLLKIKGENFPYIKFGSSDDIITGEWVIAMGNPFGLFDINSKPTVTVGVVSNYGVSLFYDKKVYKDMIQTDAAISSGNSGGPLVNALGEVIGMNTVIFSTAQDQKGAGSIGIGFAIPINRVKKVIDILAKNKTINRNFAIGMEVREIDDRIARYLTTNIKEGVVIYSINRRSPAEDSGLEPGDIILEIDGTPVIKLDDYYINVYDGVAGQTLNLLVNRSGQKITKKLFLKPI